MTTLSEETTTRRVPGVALTVRLLLIVAGALILAVLVSAGIPQLMGAIARVVDYLASFLPASADHLASVFRGAANVFRGSEVSLGTAGIAVAGLMATWKECMTAVEVVFVAYPRVAAEDLKKASLRLFVTLVVFFVGVLATKAAAAPLQSNAGLALSFQGFLMPVDVSPQPGLLTVFVPFEHDAGIKALEDPKDPGIFVPDPYRRFLRSLSVALAGCRDAATPAVRLEVAGFATGARYSENKANTHTLAEMLVAKSTSPAAVNSLQKIQSSLPSQATTADWDTGFDLFAASRRASSAVACLLGDDTCAIEGRDAENLTRAPKLTSSEIEAKEWTSEKAMRDDSLNDRAAAGVSDTTVRGFLTRYARVRVLHAGKCERKSLVGAFGT